MAAIADVRFNKQADSYYVGAGCSNCGWRGKLRIEKGRRAPWTNTCPSCACPTVRAWPGSGVTP